uniref:HRAS-like suppressor 3 n=1 Tax=Callorhinchus milii TaxID=7868 RepID=A0A4W3HCC1_CALMI
MSAVEDKAVVRKEKLWVVVGNHQHRVNNKLDDKRTPLDAWDIVSEAERWVGLEVPYNISCANCEHFVTKLRYGQASSSQETCVSRTQQLNVSEWGTARASAIDRAVTGHMDLDIHHVEPKPGDQIEIFRQTYQHWAIYVGNGYVIHITLPNKACSGISLFGVRALVKKELLRDVHRGDHYQVNNTLDSLWPPRAAEDIVRDAEKFVGLKVSYKLLKANCEHFITRLRYGADWSGQVWRFLNLLYVMGIPVSLRVRKHLYKLKRQSKPS